MTSRSLVDKTAFVPGGYGALGDPIARALAAAGARVAVAGRDAGKAEALAAELRATGGDAAGFGMDATDVAAIRGAVDAARDRFGRLDLLVNCVGIQIEQPLLAVTEEAYDAVYAANLKSAMFLAQAVARHQIDGGRGGRQVHLLSVRSQLALRGRGYSAYSSTKGGLAMLVKQHAMELAPHGITVNGVAPTFVRSEMIRRLLKDDGFEREMAARIPLGRLAEPEDVCGPVLFFAGPAAAFVTGQVLYVDGGITASQ